MRLKKRLALALVVIFLVTIVAAGCGQKAGTGDQANNEPAKEETIKIGLNYELSGGVATFGTNTVNAILLAFDEINANGGVLGKKIEPIKQDNKSENAESTNVATKLVGEKVVAIIGAATTGNTLAAEPVVTSNKIPMLTTSATNPKVTVDPATGKVRDFVFRTCFIDPPQGIVGADFAFNTLKAKTAVLFKDTNNDYSKGLADNFKQAFEKLGGKVVAEEGYLEKDTDFKAALTKIKNKKPDVIYVPGYYAEVGLIVKQGRDLGITAAFLGADGWDSPELVSTAGPANLKNTFFTNHYSSQDPDPAIQKFVEAYKAKYGAVPDGFAALGYDAAYLIADAITRAGAADPEKIKDALAQTKDFPAVTGMLTYDEFHNPIKQIAIIEMVDGKQVLKTKIAPK